jgi:hypothetical protein
VSKYFFSFLLGKKIYKRKEKKEGTMRIERKEIIVEAKKQLWLVGPMMMVFLFQNLQVITLIFVGHLNQELLLAGASLGISILNVSGYNIMVRILHFCFQFIFTFKRNILFSVCI